MSESIIPAAGTVIADGELPDGWETDVVMAMKSDDRTGRWILTLMVAMPSFLIAEKLHGGTYELIGAIVAVAAGGLTIGHFLWSLFHAPAYVDTIVEAWPPDRPDHIVTFTYTTGHKASWATRMLQRARHPRTPAVVPGLSASVVVRGANVDDVFRMLDDGTIPDEWETISTPRSAPRDHVFWSELSVALLGSWCLVPVVHGRSPIVIGLFVLFAIVCFIYAVVHFVFGPNFCMHRSVKAWTPDQPDEISELLITDGAHSLVTHLKELARKR